MQEQCSQVMAVRQITGSAQLIGLLNGLDHYSSNVHTLEHDTAFAQLQVK